MRFLWLRAHIIHRFMSLTAKEISHIAKLARLKTSEQDAEFYAVQISRIMDLVEQMNKIDTTGVEPMSHPQDATLRMREDVVTATNQRDEYQAIAPESENGLYLVPKVIE